MACQRICVGCPASTSHNPAVSITVVTANRSRSAIASRDVRDAGNGWAWTGLASHVTLWDWLEGLALPVTVGLVPLMLRHRDRLGRQHKTAAIAALLAFAALVLAGYLVPMSWTGFPGNTLWDWLTLA